MKYIKSFFNRPEKSLAAIFASILAFLGIAYLNESLIFCATMLAGSASLMVCAIFKPHLLLPMVRAWLKLGDVLHRIVSPIMLLIIFVAAICLPKLILAVLRKKLLTLKPNPASAKTYWRSRVKNNTSFDRLF